MLEMNKVNCSSDGVRRLWNVSLKVSQNQVCSIIGSKGAGKSTLLQTISGLAKMESGEIRFLGERIDRLRPHEIAARGIAHVPEGRGLFASLTVRENLRIGAFLPEARKKFEDSLALAFDLFPTLKERQRQISSTLSGGEQQMLAIARGLMSRPKLLMLDEPSSGLMPKLIPAIFKIIASLREKGLAILLVEQNVNQALEISDEAFVMQNGSIVLKGTKDELLKNELVKKEYTIDRKY